MGKNYRIPRYGGVHANLTVVLTPLMGRRKGVGHTLRTITSLNHDLAPKYSTIGGTQIAPVNVVLAGSQPKWDGEINMIEATEIQVWMGPGWAAVPLNIDITWQVPGNPAFTDNIFTAFLGPCSISSKKDDVVMAKLGSDCAAIWPRGIDPFAALTT